MSYKKRSVKSSVEFLLGHFPAVVILGARQVGKSTLTQELLPDATFFDLERDSDYQRINDDPALLLQETNRPIVFDEAQLSPALFRALRVAIDDNRDQPGQFLLSGSSSPELLKNISETLAGRIAIVELDPFDWHEIHSTPTSGELLEALIKPDRLLELPASFDKQQLLSLCLYGGYPEPVLKKDDRRFYRLWMESYLKTYIERDIRVLFPQLNIDAYKRFIQMLAFSSGDIINASAFARSLDVSQTTIKNYLEIVEGTFLWRRIPSWQKNVNKRIVKTPKGHLRDTGLINYMLRIQDVNDMKSHPQFGKIWETFIAEQLIRQFTNQLERLDYYYYRTQNQAEVDLILETEGGLIPIEIKAGSVTAKRQLKALEAFIEEHNCAYGLVVNNGDEVYKMSPKIYQLPAAFL